MNRNSEPRHETGLEVAIIGISGRFPGAKNTSELWENLKNGVESVTFLTAEELTAYGLSIEQQEAEKWIGAKGLIPDNEFFDAGFFDFRPIDAELMDPQIRLYYECVWDALEISGYNPDSYEGLIGLYAGSTNNRLWEFAGVMSPQSKLVGNFGRDHLVDRDFLATRIAHRLNLRGPAIAMKTACSTSLVAVDLACRGLLTGQCDIAIAGGVSITSKTVPGYTYREGMIASPDGHCRAFDASSKGVVFSDGAGAVVLKRLSDAIADRDNIWAVILSTAVNNDGNRKSTYEAPCVEGQADVIRSAIHMAEVPSETITYVETHGTGTVIGDPIEIEALRQAFNTDKRKYCGVGSIKTNLGHLDTAAGIAGFIKTILSLKHKQIPPSLHFKIPNPKIDFEHSPFYVNSQLQDWKTEGFPRRAGCSSFGVGGTNVHAILEEAPEPEPVSGSRRYQMIVVSAKTETALDKSASNLSEFFKNNPETNLPDAVYTLHAGRKPFNYRRMLIARDIDEAARLLEASTDSDSPDFARSLNGTARERNRLMFMFSGQGSQYVNMGRDLYETEPVFRKTMDRCFEILKPIVGYDMKEILYPRETIDSDRINQTEVTQPVIFAFEYSIAMLLKEWGILPYAMIGHSIGEYVAACLAEVFTLEDALKLVALRGKLMQEMPSGGMMSVPMSEEELKPLMIEHKELSLAAVNAPSLCVVSGPHAAIDAFEDHMKTAGKGDGCRKLHTSHAFHSSMMDPILKRFEEVAATIPFNKPQIPYISNVTGKWITVEDVMSPQYWSTHLRNAVRYSDGITELVKESRAIFLELGPGRSLATFVSRHPGKQIDHIVMNLVKHPQEEVSDDFFFLTNIGRLWLYGENIGWQGYYREEVRRRVVLPTYPYEKQRYTIEADKSSIGGKVHDMQKKENITEWFYTPSWKRSGIPQPMDAEALKASHWLFFTGNDSTGIASHLINRIKETESAASVTTVEKGNEFSSAGENHFTVNPTQPNDYLSLIKELKKADRVPQHVVHMWNVTGPTENRAEIDNSDELEFDGFYSLIYLAQAFGSEGTSGKLGITVLTDNMQDVLGNESISPRKSTVLGPVNIIPIEYPTIKCRSIDILTASPGTPDAKLLNRLFAEIKGQSADSIVAFRGNYRMVHHYEPLPLEKPAKERILLKESGVYLITGGLGGIGLAVAEHLARTVKAKLILTGRSAFPEPSEWDRWIATHSPKDPVSIKIHKIRELEQEGAQVMVINGDVTDYSQMKQAIETAEAKLGRIDGLFHAAGLPGGGMIQLKTPEIAGPVLAPKVKGTLVLDKILKDHTLDFIALCSSINSVLPRVGQVDYFSANAFLDAYAVYKNTRDQIFTVSINWDSWQEVGMAVEAAKQRIKVREMTHPLFDRCILDEPQQEVFETYFNLDKHWVLNEHKIRESGKGLVPGVTYLEMAREAFSKHVNGGNAELSEVFFLNPLMVGPDEERETQLILKKKQKDEKGIDIYEFQVQSRHKSTDNVWQIHAVGKIKRVEKDETPVTHNLDELFAKCDVREVSADHSQRELTKEELESGLLIFGRRWGGLKKIRMGHDEGLAFIELDDEYKNEVAQFNLYPSLLDTATGFLFSSVGGGAYIPFSYKQLTQKHKLPAKFYSHSVVLKEGESTLGQESLKFNITLIDEHGVEIVKIKEFTMLQVSQDVQTKIRHKDESPSVAEEQQSAALDKKAKNAGLLLKDGIRSAEGVEAFERIISGSLPRVIVSPIDLEARLMQIAIAQESSKKEKVADKPAAEVVKRSRPPLGSAYIAPKTETELLIAGVWQKILGIEQIGINDNFFELGGDSLMIVQLNGELKKVLNRDIPVAVQFIHLTIHSFAEYLKEGEQGSEETPQEADRSTEIDKGKDRLKARLKRN